MIHELGNNYYALNSITPNYYAYAGFLLPITFANIGAAYVAVKSITTVTTGARHFFQAYNVGGNALTCFQAIIEGAIAILNLVWAAGISFGAYYLSYGMWSKIVAKEKKGALSMSDGLYYLTLGAELAASASVAAYALGEQTSLTIGYFAVYDGSADASGSSMLYDTLYQIQMVLISFLATSVIAAGGLFTMFVYG